MDSVAVPLFLFSLIALAIVGMLIGNRRGQAALGGILGVLLGPIGLLIIMSIVTSDPPRYCPYCKGKIDREATACRHCTRSLNGRVQS